MNAPVTLPSEARDNFGHRYVVTIEPNAGNGYPVLAVKGTPGRWYLSTLFRAAETSPMSRIAVDLGQGWFVEGFAAVLAEAREAARANAWVAEGLACEDPLDSFFSA